LQLGLHCTCSRFKEEEEEGYDMLIAGGRKRREHTRRGRWGEKKRKEEKKRRKEKKKRKEEKKRRKERKRKEKKGK